LWSFDTKIGRTWEGKKQLLDVRGPKAFISHTTTAHVKQAEEYADEVVQPVIVPEIPKDVIIGRDRKYVPDHWCYFPYEGYGDIPTDQTEYKVVFRLDGAEAIALFPEIPMDAEGVLVQVYGPRKGIYGGHYDDIMNATRPLQVTDKRALALKEVLQRRGFTYVKPIGRATDRMKEVRVAKAKERREQMGAKLFDLYEWMSLFEKGELPEDQEIELFQHLVDSDLVRKLPGRIQLHALKLIEKGKVLR
jgi:hypothetical protein